MDIPELSKALREEQTVVVQRYLDGLDKALASYGWVTDIVGPSYISRSFPEIAACYHGYPFTLTLSNSRNTIHARGRTVPEMEASSHSIKNLTDEGHQGAGKRAVPLERGSKAARAMARSARRR